MKPILSAVSKNMDQRTLQHLLKLERGLVDAEKVRPFLKRNWAEGAPLDGGVYAIWTLSKMEPVYVGESASLKKRMADLSRTVNHTFRRNIAKLRGWQHLNDSKLSQRIQKEFGVSWLELHLGRAELEEFLVVRWREFIVNKNDRRGHVGNWYEAIQKLTSARYHRLYP